MLEDINELALKYHNPIRYAKVWTVKTTNVNLNNTIAHLPVKYGDIIKVHLIKVHYTYISYCIYNGYHCKHTYLFERKIWRFHPTSGGFIETDYWENSQSNIVYVPHDKIGFKYVNNTIYIKINGIIRTILPPPNCSNIKVYVDKTYNGKELICMRTADLNVVQLQ